MTDAENSEVTIDELIQTIKNEVAKQQKSLMLNQSPAPRGAVISPTKLSNIEALLNAATAKSQVRTDLPHKFNRFPWNLSQPFKQVVLKAYGFLLKEQRAVNFSLIQALRESLLLNRQLAGLLQSLQLQADENRDHLHKVEAQLNSDTEGRLYEIDTLNDRLATAESHLKDSDDRLSALSAQLSALKNFHLRNDTYLKNDLAQQKRLIALFLEEAQRRLPEPLNSEELQTLVNEQQHSLDAFYVAFEDRFRGSPQSLHSRFKVYLPLIEHAQVGTIEAPILDVGCGRGEWLALLREYGYAAKGIDINRVMLEQCQAVGLEAQEADAIAYLRSLPDLSLGAVSAFHIIEHLPFTRLVCLLDESLRVLKPGGLILFETPNIRNILVGAGDFYRDPTHQTPLHPDTLSFVAESRGFVRSASYFFEEKTEPSSLIPSSSIEFNDLNDYVNISRDVVLVAHKA